MLHWQRGGKAALILMLSLMALLPVATTGADAGASVLKFRAPGDFATNAELELKTATLSAGTPIPFRLVIRDAAGYPLAGAQVRCDLVTPAAPGPKNEPRVGEKDGVYTGKMTFSRAGYWRAVFSFTPRDGSAGQVVFDLGRVHSR